MAGTPNLGWGVLVNGDEGIGKSGCLAYAEPLVTGVGKLPTGAVYCGSMNGRSITERPPCAPQQRLAQKPALSATEASAEDA